MGGFSKCIVNISLRSPYIFKSQKDMGCVIHTLPKSLISQIAAGEVIENPSSVLKELIENSLDAGADQIDISVRENGFGSIQVRDNGIGIFKDDIPLAIQSFATSKLRKVEDLYQLQSLGFRGEALGAIASVSNILLESKARNSVLAHQINCIQGEASSTSISSLPSGTRIIVSDLFHNVPVRKEFQKNIPMIKEKLNELVTDFALGYPNISFNYSLNKESVMRLNKAENLSQRIRDIFSKNFLDSMMPLYYEGNSTGQAISKIEGYISNFTFYKSNASMIRFFVNRRIVQYKRLVGMFKRAYGELMPPGRFPIAFLFLQIDPQEIDVNIHPQKKEIKFKNENSINDLLFRSVIHSIEGRGPLKMRHLQKQNKKNFAAHSHESIASKEQKLNFSIPLKISADPSEKSFSKEYPEIKESMPGNGLLEESFTVHSEDEIFPQKVHARLYDTFVLASSEDGIFLIDQHTAHERVNYEKYLKKLASQKNIVQKLFSPIALKLSIAEQKTLSENKEYLEELGFEIEDMGPAGFVLNGVPFYINPSQEEKALELTLQFILEGKEGSIELFRELAASLSCRNAIKKEEQESLFNLSQIIQELRKCENPGRCPHGRPTLVFLGKKEIFDLFKRSGSRGYIEK